MLDVVTTTAVLKSCTTSIKNAVETLKTGKDAFSTKGAGKENINITAALASILQQTTQMGDAYQKTIDSNLTLQKENTALKEQHAAVKKQIVALRKKIKKMREFDVEKADYEKINLAHHSFAYRAKAGTVLANAPQEQANARIQPVDQGAFLCGPCFENRTKSYLTFDSYTPATKCYRCPKCQTTVHEPREPDRIMVAGNSVTQNLFKGYRL